MRMRAAVLEEFGKPLVVQELDLAEPRSDDGATFKKIEAWYTRQLPRVLEGLESVQQKETVGMDGREVARIIAAEGRPRTLESVRDVHSEFQQSMEQLAAEIDANAAELEASAQ